MLNAGYTHGKRWHLLAVKCFLDTDTAQHFERQLKASHYDERPLRGVSPYLSRMIWVIGSLSVGCEQRPGAQQGLFDIINPFDG